MAQTTEQTTFRATVLREGGEWIAHCLDLDIVESGRTREDAVHGLANAIGLQLAYAREHDNFAHLFRPAPAAAWQKLAEILAQKDHRTMVVQIDDSESGVNLVEAKLAA